MVPLSLLVPNLDQSSAGNERYGNKVLILESTSIVVLARSLSTSGLRYRQSPSVTVAVSTVTS